MFHKLNNEEFKQLNDNQCKRYIEHAKKNMSAKTKLNIVEYASTSEQGTKDIIIQLYNSISKKIIKFFNSKKTDYCYVHFTFLNDNITPTVIINQDKDSYPGMYCIKYRKFL